MSQKEKAGIARLLTVAVIVTSNYELPAAAETRDFLRIVSVDTPIPGGIGNFATWIGATSLGNIVFAGAGADSQRGIYQFDRAARTIAPIVDSNTSPPAYPRLKDNLPQNISNFGLSVYGPDVSFVAPDIVNNRNTISVFTTRGGLHRVNYAPSGATTFPSGPTSLDATGVAFHVSYSSDRPYPRLANDVDAVLDDGTLVYGYRYGDVQDFRRVGGSVYTAGLGMTVGTLGPQYVQGPGFSMNYSYGALIPGNVQLPGESGRWVSTYLDPTWSVDDRTTVFEAASSATANGAITRLGLFSATGGSPLQVVADNNTIIPGRDNVTTFGGFGGAVVDGGVIVFEGGPTATLNGTSTGPLGIFVKAGGSLYELVAEGDTLDGRTISRLFFNKDRAFSGSDFVFTASFTDGSSGLYLASVPEPGFAFIAATVAFPLLARGRRHRALHP